MPGHWRVTPSSPTATARSSTARGSTSTPPRRAAAGSTLDGIFYQADVWLDGAYLGDPEGYFFPHSFDITDLPASATSTCWPSRSTCPPQRDGGQRNITGVFQHWDCIDRRLEPGRHLAPGARVRHRAGRIDRLRVLCRDADEDGPTCSAARPTRQRRPARVTLRTIVDGVVVADDDHAGGRPERGRLDTRRRHPRCGGRGRSASSR